MNIEKQKLNIACVYHYPCADGLAAAAAVEKKYEGEKISYFPTTYHKPIPEILLETLYDKIFIVDFSYSYEETLRIAKQTDHLVVLDHHKTAEKELANRNWPKNCTVIFDMKRSGAGLAWDLIVGRRTLNVRYVEDRDLWNWKYGDNSKYFHTAVSIDIIENLQLDDTRKVYAMLSALKGHDDSLAIGEWYQKMWDTVIDTMTYQYQENKIWFNKILDDGTTKNIGVPCRIIRCPGRFASDACNKLLLDVTFNGIAIAVWNDLAGDKMKVSMRAKNNYDVSEVAKYYGGGGHANAAGFETFINENVMFTNILRV